MTEQPARATPIPSPGIPTPVHQSWRYHRGEGGVDDTDEGLTSYTASANATYSPSRITGRLTQPPGNWSSENLTRESDNGNGGNSELHCVVVLS
jgi:hypothetical protein